MTLIDIDRLLSNVAEAADDAKGGFLRQTGRAELLDRFWALQDNMRRLVQAVSDHRDQTLLRLTVQHPHLRSTISDFVQDVSSSRSYSIAAIAGSCRSIQCSLEVIGTLQARADLPILRHSACVG